MRKAKLLFITAALATVLTVPAHAASVGAATVQVDALNLRSAPSTAASILATANENAVVIIGDKSSALWYRVVYRGFTGYMKASYLSSVETLEGDFGNGSVRSGAAALREAPDLFAPSLGYCQSGATVNILGVSGSWYKVQYGSATGYLHSGDVAVTIDANKLPVTADAKLSAAETETRAGQTIVETAMKYLGCPYVYGGTSPSGFDCSGFVQYVYNECGISVTRTAASIYASDGVAVDKSALEPGDVLCFSNSSEAVGHVGIYIGNGQFIHASTSSTGVIISPLDMDYWVRNYVGAKRIVSADANTTAAAATT